MTRYLTEKGFSPPQAAVPLGRAVRRLWALARASCSITDSGCLCENGWKDICTLPIEYCFRRSVVRRSHGEKQERTLDQGALRYERRSVCATHATPRWS